MIEFMHDRSPSGMDEVLSSTGGRAHYVICGVHASTKRPRRDNAR
jgi:hypothetical protein